MAFIFLFRTKLYILNTTLDYIQVLTKRGFVFSKKEKPDKKMELYTLKTLKFTRVFLNDQIY